MVPIITDIPRSSMVPGASLFNKDIPITAFGIRVTFIPSTILLHRCRDISKYKKRMPEDGMRFLSDYIS